MKKWFLLLTFFNIQMVQAESVSVNMFQAHQEALKLYVEESNDYINTLDNSFEEFKAARVLMLQEKFETQVNTLETNLIKGNREIITEIDSYIVKNPDVALDDILIMRQAQLHYEKANFQLQMDMKSYEKELEAYLQGRRKEEPKLPVPNYEKAIAYCTELLEHFPLSPVADKANYLLGYLYEERSQWDMAEKYYNQFLKTYPYSTLKSEVAWRLAEYYFDRGDYMLAAKKYAIIVVDKDETYYKKAVYKLGAAFYALSKYPEALAQFETLYTATSTNFQKGTENQVLLDESIEYMGVLESKGFTSGFNPTVKAQITEKLAEMFVRSQMNQQAREAYLKYVKSFPNEPAMPRFLNAVLNSYVAESREEDAQKIRDYLIARLDRSSPWWKANKQNVIETFATQDILEKQLLESARYYASKGYVKDDRALLEKAKVQYQSFLNEYAYSNHSGEARLELAEILYFNGNYKEAAQVYKQIAVDPLYEEYKEEASYGYFLSAVKYIKYPLDQAVQLAPKFTEKGTLSPPTQMTDVEKSFTKAAEFYIQNGKPSERMQKVGYKLSELHFQKNDFSNSETSLNEVVAMDPQSATALKSQMLAAEIYNMKGETEKYQAAHRESVAMTSNISFKSDLGQDEILGVSSLDQAKAFEKSGQMTQAADEYEKSAATSTNLRVRDYAHWKAAALYCESGDYLKCEEHNQAIQAPEYQEKAAYLKANLAMRVLKYEEAAQLYAGFAKKYPKSEKASDALMQASFLYRDLKKYKEASLLMREYLKRSYSPTLEKEMLQWLAKAQDITALQSYYAEVSAYDRSRGYATSVALAEAYYQKGEKGKALETCEKSKSISEHFSQMAGSEARTRCDLIEFEANLYKKKYSSVAQASGELKKFTSNRVTNIVIKANLIMADYLSGNSSNTSSNAGLPYYQAAYDVTQGYPFSDEARLAIEKWQRMQSKPVMRNDYLINWNSYYSSIMDWTPVQGNQSARFNEAKSQCERAQFKTCLGSLSGLYKENSTVDMVKNLIHASSMAQSELQVSRWIQEYARLQGWTDQVQATAYAYGQSKLIPGTYQQFEISKVDQKAFAYLANAEMHWTKSQIPKSLQIISDAIKEKPGYKPSYVLAARIFYEAGYSELSYRSLKVGLASNNGTVMASLSRQFEQFVYHVPGTTDIQNLSADLHDIYQGALEAMMQKKEAEYLAFRSKFEAGSAYALELDTIRHIFYQSSLPQVQSDALESAHTSWLMSLAYIQMPQESKNYMTHAIDLGLRNKLAPDLLKVYDRRGVAGSGGK